MQGEHVETLIVGGGQAGLSVAYGLQQLGRESVVLDASERVGDAWRRRWDSLRLYSPAAYNGLPGMPFPAAPTSYPTGREMADYLEAYARRFALRVESGVKVETLARDGGRYVVSAGGRRFEAANVVVATGVCQAPFVPAFAAELDPRIRQLHSSDYRGPDALADGPVLVVGASHSGSDIAWEAAADHETILAGRSTGQLPVRVDTRRGRLLFRALFFLGSRVLTVDTRVGRKLRKKIRSHGAPLLRIRAKDLRAAGVERVLDRVVGVSDGLPVLAGGRVLDVSTVVWCTGFEPDYGWIRFPLELGDDGYPRQYRGVADAPPGLYFVGMPFLHSFSSMLVGGAGRDAERVVAHIAARPAHAGAPAAAPALTA